jgi:hypothetical protein
MVNQNGKTLASPVRLTDFTFRTVFVRRCSHLAQASPGVGFFDRL